MKKNKILNNPLFVAGILTSIVIIITFQGLLPKREITESNGLGYTHYNNYLIFKQSFFHLIENKDLYVLYPTEHFDYYKYSPAFSLLMAPFAYLPDAFGLFFWNLLNVLLLFFAIWKLPSQSNKIRLFILGFIFIELVTSVQNSQCNALIAGLILFAFIFLEKKQVALASLFIVLTIFIKLFGLVALALFVFYPNKLKAVIYTIGWALIFVLLPLLVITPSQLSFLYQSWYHLLQNDHSASIGLSLAGWLYSWFGIEAKSVIVLLGAILFCLPFFNYKFFNDLKFKLLFLASTLIWIVIFNHKAESPSFIIAISGIAIWFFSQKIKIENVILLIVAFIFTVLSATDVFPKSIRDNYIVPYVVKAVPCILIWFKITFDLIFYKPENNLINTTSIDAISQSITG
jgi:hypothetical protein